MVVPLLFHRLCGIGASGSFRRVNVGISWILFWPQSGDMDHDMNQYTVILEGRKDTLILSNKVFNKCFKYIDKNNICCSAEASQLLQRLGAFVIVC